MVGVAVVVAGITKSAQIPFSYWLPAAISAPTPVSALVHSSTLVAAGVYLLFRAASGLGEVPVLSLSVLAGVSLLTMTIARFRACFEVDLKKVIAFSTLSQLGIIIFTIRIGFYMLAFFHMMSHALFKALMFIGVGRVIHNCRSSQDIRDISGLWASIPITSGVLGLGVMALIGLPFLRGYYAKDLILEMYLSGGIRGVISGMLIVTVLGTVVYRVRIFMYRVFGKANKVVLGGERRG